MMRLISLAALMIIAEFVHAQEPLDALRYSMTGYGGTARARAIGGAMTSLGGDLSAASVNPAGLAFYRTHEFVLTPSFSFGSQKTNYLNTDTKGKSTTPDFNNIGLILPKSGSWNGNWRNFTYGVGMNKTVNFSNTQKLSGLNTESSYSEKYLEELINNNVTDPNLAARNFPFGSSLAFNTFLVDTISGPNGTVNGYRSLSTPQTGVRQEQTITTKGRINELFIAASGNYMDRLYVGGSLMFSQLRFERNSSFKESDATKMANNFNYFQTDEFLSTEGIGVGVKLGIIVRPVDRIRIGISYHSPVLYNMDDRYNSKVTTDLEGYQGNGVLTQSSADLNSGENGQYQYDFVNPMRIMAGFSYVFQEVEDVTQQRGFISADVEYINHAKSKFRQPGSLGNSNNGSSYLQEVNDAIANQFKSALNFRVGGELKFNTFMTRLGFNMMSNAYAIESLKARQMNISGGVGYRNRGYFVDITYVHALTKDASFPYRLDNGFFAPGMISGSRGTILATIGLKF